MKTKNKLQGGHKFICDKEITRNMFCEIELDPIEVFGTESPTKEMIRNWLLSNQHKLFNDHINGVSLYYDYVDEHFSRFTQIEIDNNVWPVDIIDSDERMPNNSFGIKHDFEKLLRANFEASQRQISEHTDYVTNQLNQE